MKRLALIAAVVLTTITLQSCRQSDDVLSPEETATLQRVQDSSNNLLQKDNANNLNTDQNNNPASLVDGEIVPPPKK
ncbi:hypothetical protein [Kaistella jeonii]|uniref:Uncharacterized protein n=1 Tax=Kaistella jeonii TaxID=266749 RepID=A0A0C1FBT2_9FLAO|nr:hypothetical protein [Kaistella jeonii]KIA90542.1 hypothetical protein OA86_01265 [Kaistella jeonii]SFB71160.1 hypothetical protein SAMN05421876_101275 [Kaistella jeonii]VEI94868.1 Uncharacterised protein [Kaistella jeonii]